MTRRKRLQAPPPTPEGMVWRTNDYGQTVLVSADQAHAEAAAKMARFDCMPVFMRRKFYGSEERS